MKDEEMAEEYAENLYKQKINYADYSGEGLVYYRSSDIKEAFLAGLKAGRPQWHDLRKDPDDLPEEEKIVLIFIEGGIKLIDCYDKYRGWHTYSKAKIIAWCEIPKFEGVPE